MKKFFGLVAVMAVVANVFSSCEKDDELEVVMNPFSTSESSGVTISSDALELNFASSVGSSQILSLESNGEWEMTNVPDWIRPSVTKGNGNKSVSLSVISENKSANPRTAIITVSTVDHDINITVHQYGNVVASCVVKPNHVTTLYNGIAFDMDYSNASNVAHYYRGYLEASRAGIMTTDEIIWTLTNDFMRHLPSDDEVADFSGLKANTKYIIYTLAYNMDGKRGELFSTEVSTEPSVSNDPCAWIGDITCNGSYWYWSVTKSATCYSYYMMATERIDIAEASDVLQAWWLEDAVRRNQITEYLNGGNWQMTRSANMMAVWTRGANSMGKLAGKIEWKGVTVGSTRTASVFDDNKNLEGDHSGRKLKEDEFKLYLKN